MTATEVLHHVRKRPFEPFRMFLSDGSKRDVRYPEFVLVTRREILIGVPLRNARMPERLVFINPVNIIRIDPIGPRSRGA